LDLSRRVGLLASLAVDKNVDELLLVESNAVLFWDRHNPFYFNVLLCCEAENFKVDFAQLLILKSVLDSILDHNVPVVEVLFHANDILSGAIVQLTHDARELVLRAAEESAERTNLFKCEIEAVLALNLGFGLGTACLRLSRLGLGLYSRFGLLLLGRLVSLLRLNHIR